jgi:DNA polymerase-3 subunit beta
MKTIFIDAAELKAVRVFAAELDIRSYLNGVLVQATATTTRIVATDGSVVGVFDREQKNENIVFEEIIIPTDVIDTLKPDNKLPVRVLIANGWLALKQYDDRELTFKSIDGRFPDIGRVIPSQVSGEPCQFHGSYLARIEKAQKLIDKKQTAYIWHNGKDAALFSLQGAHRFIGVQMPFMHDKKQGPLPVPNVTRFKTRLAVPTVPVIDTADDLT